MTAVLLWVWSAALALAAAPGSGGDHVWTSESGRFRLHYESRLEPITISRMHTWVLHLETAAGEPVSGATITVEGGMPAHDHGLPTSPRVTRELGNGDYLLEGVRFHMNGAWEMTFTLQVDAEHDVVVVPLEL